ncbi:MAG: mannose-6-phosphate isomerase, class I [Saprospiraceae bacterium]|nr:mannose-6-phosphate isomerase, class I [Saprospiraceae bacterium]
MTGSKIPPIPIQPSIQHYAWGGKTLIPSLAGIQNDQGEPFAEWWIGDHPKSPALAFWEDQWQPLNELIGHDPNFWLGSSLQSQFGDHLPFLFKVLDVHDMLSIQIHPTKVNAEIGFAREEKLNRPLDAYDRVFKDANHKPELMVAISEFWLLHGFQNEKSLRMLIGNVPEWSDFLTILRKRGLKGLYTHIMQLSDAKLFDYLSPLRDRVLPAFQRGELTRFQPEYWAAKAFLQYGLDRGIFSIFLLNLVCLLPGEGIFQDAGIPHAYLEGQNVEIMANSDNVFRGGLTSKYVDVDLLLEHVFAQPVEPEILKAKKTAQGMIYEVPVPDFKLYEVRLSAGQEMNLPAGSPGELIVIRGQGKIISDRRNRALRPGSVFYLVPESSCSVHADESLLAYVGTC